MLLVRFNFNFSLSSKFLFFPFSRKLPPPPDPKFIFVRQETEEMFTALCLPQQNLQNLTKAVSDKYQVIIAR